MIEGYRRNRADLSEYDEAEEWYLSVGGDDAFSQSFKSMCNDQTGRGDICYRKKDHKGPHAYIWSWPTDDKPGRVWATWFTV